MKTFLFDMNLTAAIRVQAETAAEAAQMLKDALQAADANFGAWPTGDPITGEVTLNEEPILAEDDNDENPTGE